MDGIYYAIIPQKITSKTKLFYRGKQQGLLTPYQHICLVNDKYDVKVILQLSFYQMVKPTTNCT